MSLMIKYDVVAVSHCCALEISRVTRLEHEWADFLLRVSNVSSWKSELAVLLQRLTVPLKGWNSSR